MLPVARLNATARGSTCTTEIRHAISATVSSLSSISVREWSIREVMIPIYGSPFAVEAAHMGLRDTDRSARAIRSLSNTARQYRESIDVYGSKMDFDMAGNEHLPFT